MNSYFSGACFYRESAQAEILPPTTTLGGHGDCHVDGADLREDAGTPQYTITRFPADLGKVTIEGVVSGTTTFTDRGGDAVCMERHSSGALPFAGDEQLSIAATGGAVFPAFSTTMIAPLPLVLEAGTPTKGEPLALTWSGSGSEKVHLTISSENDTDRRTIECLVDDTGSFTVDSALTQQLVADPTRTSVRAAREVQRVFRPHGKALTMRVELTAADQR